MPRLPRLHVCGAFYHVTLRGNHRQPIFREDADRVGLNTIVREALERCEAKLHAYCWMTNHLHLLVQISHVPLGRLIQRVAGGYARWFQSRLPTTGHLFERRYHAALVDVDGYLLQVIRYIHQNPVEARLVSNPGDYPWSSHNAYLGSRDDEWVCTEFALQMFGADLTDARRSYAAFVQNDVDTIRSNDLPLAAACDSRVLGSEDFAKQLTPSVAQPCTASTVEVVVANCCRRYGVRVEDLASSSKRRALSRIRAVIAYQVGVQRAGSVAAVARLMERDESSLRQCLEHYLKTEPELFALPAVNNSDQDLFALESPESPHRHRR